MTTLTFDPLSTRSLHAHLPPDLSVVRLLVVASPDAEMVGRAVLVEEAAVEIGRAGTGAERGLRLRDSSISRRHAVVTRDEGRASVEDLGSRNGTMVDGRRSTAAGLTHGSVIRIGESVLLLQQLTVGRDELLVAEFPPLLGPSLAMERVRGQIAEVAPSSIPVLVLGPSGTGKELVAAELHRRSGRTGAFVPINCGALPRDLAESELFGHEAGAFTGAGKAAAGLFRAAHRGTLFLDEIGELPPDLQSKLLRALATGEVRSVGASRAEQTDVRIVAATNRDLARDVEAERFRGDLFARLAGWTIRLPPLRERKADVLGVARQLPVLAGGLDADAAEALLLYAWPYNVRELLSTLQAAALRTNGGTLLLRHLPAPVRAPVEARATAAPPRETTGAGVIPPALRVPRDRTPEREDLEQLLRWYGGNVSQIATFFGKERAQVYRWLRRHELDAEAFRVVE